MMKHKWNPFLWVIFAGPMLATFLLGCLILWSTGQTWTSDRDRARGAR
jgi:hypothetical protein